MGTRPGLRQAGTGEASRRRHRLRRQAQYPAPSRTGRCKVTVVPATASAEDVLALEPDGVFLSNGPGDPAATGEYAVPVIRSLRQEGPDLRDLPRPSDARARGRRKDGEDASGPPRREPPRQGQDDRQGRDHVHEPRLRRSTPEPAGHGGRDARLLFDGSNCGIALTDRPAFSVQYHPEASPGPNDSHYLFDRFVQLIEDEKQAGDVTPTAACERLGQAPGLAAAAAGQRDASWSKVERIRGCASPPNHANQPLTIKLNDHDTLGGLAMSFEDEADDYVRLHRLFTFHLGIAVSLAWMTSLYAALYAPWVRNIRPSSIRATPVRWRAPGPFCSRCPWCSPRPG